MIKKLKKRLKRLKKTYIKILNRKKFLLRQKINHLSLYLHPKVIIRHLNLFKEYKRYKERAIYEKIKFKIPLTEKEIKNNFKDEKEYFSTSVILDYYNESRKLDLHIEYMNCLIDKLLSNFDCLTDTNFIQNFEDGYKKYRKDFLMFLKLKGDFDESYRTALYNYHSKYVKGFGLVYEALTQPNEISFLQGMDYIEKAKNYLDELLEITRLLIIHKNSWQSHYKKEFSMEEIEL